MSKSIVYYITGHGLGHARRSAQVIYELVRLRSDLTVHIRSGAAESAFADVLGPSVRYQQVELDPGAVEDSPLRINPLATQRRVRAILADKAAIVRREAQSQRRRKASLVVADVPFLAGDIAQAAGVPCIACTNFTWDWIYEGWGEDRGRKSFGWLIDQIQASYRKIGTILKLPFGGRTDMFADVINVPLIVNRTMLHPGQTRRLLHMNRADGRPLVLVAQRGGVPRQALVNAARRTPEARFLCLQPLTGKLPENLTPVKLDSQLPFADVLAASDVVVSKLGYGTVADCIATKTGVLWPARVGFREDLAMVDDATRYLRHRMVHAADFLSGNWRSGLLDLFQQAQPRRSIGIDGAAVCAKIVAGRL